MSKELDGRIAVALGWKDIKPTIFAVGGDSTGIPPGELRTYVPRWSSDLNVMYELVNRLNDGSGELQRYQHALMAIVDRDYVYVHAGSLFANLGAMGTLELHDYMEATAEQKATAWLKVKEGGI